MKSDNNPVTLMLKLFQIKIFGWVDNKEEESVSGNQLDNIMQIIQLTIYQQN